jgi:hypothetical protein
MGSRVPSSFGVLAGVLGRGARVAAGGRSKYGAVRATASDGRKFASKAERDRYHDLLRLKAAGVIADLECQVIYHFPINGALLSWKGRRLRYTADFRYRDLERGDRIVVEDVKGVLLPDAMLRMALMKAVHDIEVQLVTKRRR